MQKKVYAAHSKKFDYQCDYYAPLKKLTDFEFIFPHEKGDEIQFKSKDVIKRCSVFVAEVTNPSLGTGIEIGWAESFTIPILFLYKKGAKVAASLKTISNNFIEYETIDESLPEIKKQLLMLIKNKKE